MIARNTLATVALALAASLFATFAVAKEKKERPLEMEHLLPQDVRQSAVPYGDLRITDEKDEFEVILGARNFFGDALYDDEHYLGRFHTIDATHG